jgi:hypothetical protein
MRRKQSSSGSHVFRPVILFNFQHYRQNELNDQRSAVKPSL